jgi:hypothetical protein
MSQSSTTICRVVTELTRDVANRIIEARAQLSQDRELNIMNITNIGPGVDPRCNPSCLNDGQCLQDSFNAGLNSCVCPSGYDGVDCSGLRVPDAVSLAERAFVANSGEAANMALSAVWQLQVGACLLA